MDELEKYGFIPNGGRIYYLNRSQPPLFGKVRVSLIGFFFLIIIIILHLPCFGRFGG
jgi:hypothetical protein